MVIRSRDELDREWNKLRTEHTHDRDGANNYGCYNVETSRNCNYVYNSKGCINCHNSDSLVECVQCIDCRDCAYCVGLNGARFHILNREYCEDEYYNQLRLLKVTWEVITIDPLDAAFDNGGPF
jgi:hypothetical protein